jgi:hypothetical protein
MSKLVMRSNTGSVLGGKLEGAYPLCVPIVPAPVDSSTAAAVEEGIGELNAEGWERGFKMSTISLKLATGPADADADDDDVTSVLTELERAVRERIESVNMLVFPFYRSQDVHSAPVPTFLTPRMI